MRKQKTKPRAWRPYTGQWFDARVRRYGNLHRAGPFRCMGHYGSGKNYYYIEAVDAEGDPWIFDLREFALEARKVENEKNK